MFALRKFFERCRKYGISFNPKKQVFVVTKGKLMGFIVSKDGMIIEPERSESIAKIGLPSSKKTIQFFLGKINFVKMFVSNFLQIVIPLQDVIKTYSLFKWSDIQKDAFINVNKAIMDAPTLMPPDFSKDFILYTFHIDVSYAAMLTQKNA